MKVLCRLISKLTHSQLAADQAWPWQTAGVTTIRKGFLLLTARPMTE
jgi:hypothetical protein